MFATLPELRFAPGTRVRVTHNLRVGGKRCLTKVEGVVELEGQRPVGGIETTTENAARIAGNA